MTRLEGWWGCIGNYLMIFDIMIVRKCKCREAVLQWYEMISISSMIWTGAPFLDIRQLETDGSLK